MTGSIRIARPVDQVFAYLVELHDAEWRTGVAEMRLISEDAHELGARHQEVRRVFGREVVADAEVVAYVPRHRVAFRRVKGPVRPQVTYAVEESGDDAVVVSAAMTVPVAPPVVGPVLAKLLNLTLPRELRRLRAALEAPAA